MVFNSTGFPEAVVFVAPAKTEVFTDRPARAATARARAFAADFASDCAGNPPNVAVTGWRKRKNGGWRRETATSMTFDAATGKPRYAGVRCCASTRGSWTACHPLSVSHIEIHNEIELTDGSFAVLLLG